MNAIVDTVCGKVEGAEEGGLCVFRGIPYAAPPVGARRWLPPVPPESWDGVRPALEFGPMAPQGQYGEAGLQSEDCLYLNVWTPAADDARRPVMVWIHGGGLFVGGASQPDYDAQHLCRRGDVVVVSMTYRMGSFGFLNLAEVTNGAIPATGNEGLLDMIATLEWVRDNIEAFGGDPGNVTIFGESAGGWAVGALLGVPAATGLFHKAIPQSGSGINAIDLDNAVALAVDTIADMGLKVGDVDGLRTASTEAVVAATMHQARYRGPDGPDGMNFYIRMVVDGAVLPRRVLDSVAAGAMPDVAIMAGTTRDERSNETPVIAMSDAELHDVVRRAVSKKVDVDTIVKTYKRAHGARYASLDPRELAIAIKTDGRCRQPAIRLLDRQRPHNPAVFHYIFSWVSPLGDGWIGAVHGVDYPLTFATHDTFDLGRSLSGQGPAADALAGAWQDALIAFARSGDPSTDTLGAWPAYGESRSTMIIGERTEVIDAPYEDERLAWEPYSDDDLADNFTPGRIGGDV